ncbi:hypothetical protein HMPREF0658_0784 [Hoylesella marshii DSM 16973 = JCM 13450]|uniref:Uncharacterized protein n=1 Tax=Hoylesella marshii DSM 16973 = JCM 13450 TaxID=862515 RepID=E0NRI3_9BACT|nr:hypothetical protein HMPREF0658_0784 [Hoylesella marshii DSM 16973 = JCM 13450]
MSLFLRFRSGKGLFCCAVTGKSNASQCKNTATFGSAKKAV